MKKLLFFAVFMFAAMQAYAGHVDLRAAQSTAEHFMLNKVSNGRLMAVRNADVKLLYQERSSVDASQPVYYIFNSPNGFVIVSGETRGEQVLAYGPKPLDLKRMPDNMKFWLSTYKKQIEYLQEHPGLVVETPSLKSSLKSIATVEPMLTAEWDQSEPYYNQCPIYNGSRCLTGCPATSLSMVFYYWKYPDDPTPPVEGYINEGNGLQIEALPSITFDWDNMLDRYTGNYTDDQANAVAWLMRYVGQEEHMDYSPSGSGAMGDDILRAVTFFGYDEETAQLAFKTRTDDYGTDTAVYYTDDEWAILLQNELAEGRPVVYCAYDYSSWFGWSGHAFNVDGYDASDNTYHVNWGWSGDGNGNFALNAFSEGGYTFDIEQQMIMGIQPPVQGPSIKVSSSKINMQALVGQTATATFTVKGHELTSGVTLTLDDPSGSFSLDDTNVAVSDFDDGKVITVTYAPQASGNHTATVTLTNPAAADKVVTINGTAELETYRPVMQPAQESYINLTKFRADWTDQTADDNVASYTLKVSDRASSVLVIDEDFSDLPSGSNIASNPTPYIPEGWDFEGSSLWLDGACLSVGYNSNLITQAIDLTHYDKVTVIVTAKNDNYYSSNGTLNVQTSVESKSATTAADYADYTFVLNCSESERIKIGSGSSYIDIVAIKVYAGELDAAQLRAPVEDGDASYRLITGITDKFYTVNDLTAGGTFFFKVKAIYIDGTESAWSNTQSVTLFENGHGYESGDANHDGSVTITDVTYLINALVSGGEVCDICADLNGDENITIADVTQLITLLLLAQ